MDIKFEYVRIGKFRKNKLKGNLLKGKSWHFQNTTY